MQVVYYYLVLCWVCVCVWGPLNCKILFANYNCILHPQTLTIVYTIVYPHLVRHILRVYTPHFYQHTFTHSTPLSLYISLYGVELLFSNYLTLMFLVKYCGTINMFNLFFFTLYITHFIKFFCIGMLNFLFLQI